MSDLDDFFGSGAVQFSITTSGRSSVAFWCAVSGPTLIDGQTTHDRTRQQRTNV
jgi:hypothetical protein